MKKTFSLTSLVLLATFALAQTSLPTGTAVKMKLETTLATFSSKAGDPFSARVTEPVVVDGKTVIPIGATVEGPRYESERTAPYCRQAHHRHLPRKPGPSEWRQVHAERLAG
jgi:hypothetical protein